MRLKIKKDVNRKIKPRPYARLLTMIGEQLIKNEKVALIELVKNSYDADSNWVQVRFNNFKVDKDDQNILVTDRDSYIEIEDDGIGMSLATIKEAWMNPAAPLKLIAKSKGERRTEGKKRLIQGEKGIGRYSTFKLGRKVEITTKAEGKSEILLISDLTKFDEDLIAIKGTTKPKYLDELEFTYKVKSNPQHFISSQISIRGKKRKRTSHGTIIKITHLKNNWSREKIENIFNDLQRLLETPFDDSKAPQDFLIDFKIDGDTLDLEKVKENQLKSLFDNAVIKIKDGRFSDNEINFILNDVNTRLTLKDLSDNKKFRHRFFSDKGVLKRKPECCPFDFEFYIFDLSAQAPPKYKLNPVEKDVIKNNRIYLFRDSVRVFPYGDPDDDWLGIDVQRGTDKAGAHLSNDQTIGRINISGEDNPALMDKTNREGLLEIGNSLEDFKITILAILGYLHKEFKKYKATLDRKNKNVLVKSNEILSALNDSLEKIDEKSYSSAKKLLTTAIKKYEIEKEFLLERAETTEELASVGLAVEVASHDMMMTMNRALNSINSIKDTIAEGDFEVEEVKNKLEALFGQVMIVRDLVEGIQPIFKSSRRRSKNFQIRDIIERIKKYFNSDLEKHKIKFSIVEKNIPLVVKSNEAVLLQTFINLFDNSIYWLINSSVNNKEIKITTNGDHLSLVFSDNGPGVRENDQDYIFEAFFTTKGIEGRGLGLYITDQLLQRYDHNIEYLTKNKILDGANFLITFNSEG